MAELFENGGCVVICGSVFHKLSFSKSRSRPSKIGLMNGKFSKDGHSGEVEVELLLFDEFSASFQKNDFIGI